MRRWAVLVGLAVLIAPGVAHAGTVDVLVDSNDVTLSSANGATTATVTISNLSDKPLVVTAAIPGQAGCVVKTDQPVEPARRTLVTLTFESGCHVSDGAKVALDFGTGVTPPTMTLTAAPASGQPDWDILLWSFVASAGIGVLMLAYLGVRMWRANRRLYRSFGTVGTPPAHHPRASADGQGQVPKGSYVYAITFQTPEGETALGPHSDPPTNLQAPRQVKVYLPAARADAEARVIYRREDSDRGYRRVGVIRDPTRTTFLDNAAKLRLRTELVGLGTDWSLKDNWIGNVTLGAGVLVGLFAATGVVQTVLGTVPQAAVGLIGVAGALGALFVGISPLPTKAFGRDLEVPTIGGTLFAAFLTLFGSIGQIAATTWQAAELVDSNKIVKTLVIALGVGVGLLVIWYAATALWGYIARGSAQKPATTGDAKPAPATDSVNPYI